MHPRHRPARPRILSSGRRHILGSFLFSALPQSAQPAPPAGDLAIPWPPQTPTPALVLPRWAGDIWQLQTQRGQVVLLNFWASWCEPCRAELPGLELLAHRHEADGLQVVTINYRESDTALRRFLAQMPCDLPILRDLDGRAAQAWSVRMFPSTIAISRTGQAVSRCTGEVDWSSAAGRRWVKQLLT